MAKIFQNFGNKVGNAFTNLGQNNSLLANQTQISNLSDEDRKKLQQQGLQKFADTMFLTSAIGSGDAQKIALAQNKIRQRQLDEEDAKRKANLKDIINNSTLIPDSMKGLAEVYPELFIENALSKPKTSDNSPNSYREYVRTDNTPTGAEYLTFLDRNQQSDTSLRNSTADIDNYNYYQSLDADGKKVYLQLKRLDEESLEGLESAKTKGKQGGVVVTPLQMEIDKAFGVDAVSYLTGGQAQIEANINNLNDKIRILKSGELNVSGPMVGNIPESAQSFVNPAALSFIGDIRDIVFQSLREKLGAQFTEREGDRLVAAAFDQRLPEAENVKRLERLLKTIEGAASSKESMIAHYNDKGTLDGYEQKALTFDSIFDSIVAGDFSNKSDAEIRTIFNNGDEATKNAVIRFLEKREK